MTIRRSAGEMALVCRCGYEGPREDDIRGLSVVGMRHAGRCPVAAMVMPPRGRRRGHLLRVVQRAA